VVLLSSMILVEHRRF